MGSRFPCLSPGSPPSSLPRGLGSSSICPSTPSPTPTPEPSLLVLVTKTRTPSQPSTQPPDQGTSISLNQQTARSGPGEGNPRRGSGCSRHGLGTLYLAELKVTGPKPPLVFCPSRKGQAGASPILPVSFGGDRTLILTCWAEGRLPPWAQMPGRQRHAFGCRVGPTTVPPESFSGQPRDTTKQFSGATFGR